MAKSKAFGIALAAKRGELPVEQLRGAAKHLYKTMSESELAAYASNPTEQPPKPVGFPIRINNVRSS